MGTTIKSRLAIIATLILAIVIPMLGCGSSESSKDIMARMMKMIPASADDFSFSNIKAYREDERLKDYYSWAKEEIFGDFADRIDYMGFVDDMNLWICEGDTQLLADLSVSPGKDYDSYEYKGVKITAEREFGQAHALIKDTYISGYVDRVKECIDVIVGDEISFYDHSGFKEVFGRLPSGISMEMWDPTGYSDNDIADGESTVFVGNGFQITFITLTRDGNFLERVEFKDLASE